MRALTPQEVRNLRYHSGLSLRALARVLGCHYMSLWRWERGVQSMSERFAVTLALHRLPDPCRPGVPAVPRHGRGAPGL